MYIKTEKFYYCEESQVTSAGVVIEFLNEELRQLRIVVPFQLHIVLLSVVVFAMNKYCFCKGAKLSFEREEL